MRSIQPDDVVFLMFLLVAPLYAYFGWKLAKEQAGDQNVEEYLDKQIKYKWSKKYLSRLLLLNMFMIPGFIIFFEKRLVPFNGILGILIIGLGFWLTNKYTTKNQTAS